MVCYKSTRSINQARTQKMICIEPVTDEPEFWTILKTPYKHKEARPVYMLMCDGYSSIYTFQHSVYGVIPLISVYVTTNGVTLANNAYSISLTGPTGNIRFMSPPESGTMITVYFHE